MICIECRQRADMNQGCSQACPQGCDCQHKAKPVTTEKVVIDEGRQEAAEARGTLGD